MREMRARDKPLASRVEMVRLVLQNAAANHIVCSDRWLSSYLLSYRYDLPDSRLVVLDLSL